MNFITKEFVWREFTALGLDSTDRHNPAKQEIIAYMGQWEIAATLGAVITNTKAELLAISDKDDYTPAMVGADPDQSLCGYYMKKDGTWHYVRSFVDSVTRLVNIGGTANSITAELRLGVSLSAIEFAVFVPSANNTGAVTLETDDVTLPIRNGLGEELAANDLQAGFPAMLVTKEGQPGFVLMNPANNEAVILAAKAAAIDAQGAAETAQEAAEQALSQLETAVLEASDLAFKRFNKLYLGAFAGDPTADNEGNALDEGALYFHSPSKKMKVYSTSGGWVLATPDTSDFLNRANNLNDVPSKSAARSNLGLGALAVLNKIGTGNLNENAVTDQELNSAILNALNSLPKIVGMAAGNPSNTGEPIGITGMTVLRTGTGRYDYTFSEQRSSANYSVAVTVHSGQTYSRVTLKDADGFRVETFTFVGNNPVARTDAAHDVLVVEAL